MSGICKTKQEYIDDGFSFIENPDGTVSLFDQYLTPVTSHQTKSCCEFLGFNFDIENQECMWGKVGTNELFKVILNPDGNSSTLFEVEENETCSLEVSFDYLFLFKCDDLITAKANINGITATAGGATLIDNQIKIDNLEAEISTLTNQRDFYQDLVQNHTPSPKVVECMSLTLNNYCLTTQGEIAWNGILDDKDVANVANGTIPSLPLPSSYVKWNDSLGTDTSMYGCDDVNNIIATIH